MLSDDLTSKAANRGSVASLGGVVRRHRRTLVAGVLLALVVGLAAHLLHVGNHATHGSGLSSSIYHWLRDSALAIPLATLIVVAINDFTRSWSVARRFTARLRWGLILGLGYAFALIPGGMAHGRLFPAEAHTGDAFKHALSDAVAHDAVQADAALPSDAAVADLEGDY